MVAATLASWFAGPYQDWLSGPDALLLGFGVALAAPVGDLFESSSSATPGPRTPAASSAPTAARWTA